MRKWVVVAIFAVILFAAAYLASPYTAVRHFRSLAQSGDASALAGHVDFPRVRDSLKGQLNAAIAARVPSDAALKDNPFAGLGMMLGSAIVDRMVDALVTPDGVAAMVRAGKVPSDGDKVQKPPTDLKISSHYLALDRFKMTIAARDALDKPLGMIFERNGLFDWRLVRIELPMPPPAP